MPKRKFTPIKKEYHQVLKTLHYNHWRRTYPNMPEHSYPRKSWAQKDANSTTRSICDFINYSGGVANRINNGAVYDRKLKIYRKGSVTPGVPDIDATFRGKAIKIEVKAGKDRLSQAQVKMKERMEKAGALYYVARDFDGFFEWWQGIFRNE